MSIDHAAKASSALQTAREQFQAELISGENFTAKLAYAQVHATLALVEQKRIANLIALATVTVAVPPDIAVALGIEADHE